MLPSRGQVAPPALASCPFVPIVVRGPHVFVTVENVW